jgi:hypothetical protein
MKIFLSAFTKVAQKQFATAVGGSIISFYVKRIPVSVQKHMLNVIEEEVVAKIYQESKSNVWKREQLRKKLNSLMEANKLVEEYCAGM